MNLYRRMMLEARSSWPALAIVLGIQLLYVPISLLQPLPLRMLADNVIGKRAWPRLVTRALPGIGGSRWFGLILVVALTVLIALVSQIHNVLAWVVVKRTSVKISLDFRAKLFDHLQRLPLPYHDKAGTGDAIYRVSNDGDVIKDMTVGLMPYAVSFLTMLGMCAVMFRIDPILSLIACAPLPLAILLLVTQRQSVRKRWDAVYERESAAFGVVQEVMSSLRIVRAFGGEERESRRYRRLGEESNENQVKATILESGLDALMGGGFALGMAGMMLVGVLRIGRGLLTFGDLLLFFAYSSQFYEPLARLSRAAGEVQQRIAAAKRAFAVLDIAPEVIEEKNAVSVSRVLGAYSLQHVAFSYSSSSEEQVLKDVTLEISSRARVGIYGRSGAGKTTLVNLLTRFYDPTEGRICLDNLDLRRYRLSDLRNQFSIVQQEPVLFSASVAENIAYALPGASMTQIARAAEQANAREFIEALPEGYDTLVGERGFRLSGGERQRVSLARAFLRDAPVLILDEPTSAVDGTTESAIIEALDRLTADRTTFIVAHRLSTLSGCGVILEVLPQGSVVVRSPGTGTGGLEDLSRSPSLVERSSARESE